MNKGNYLYLGIAASFFLIAIIQWTIPDMLPISLYVSIAWVSLEVAIMELLKTSLKYMQALRAHQIKVTQDELDLCNRHICVLGKFESLKNEIEQHTSFCQLLIERAEKLNRSKSTSRLEIAINAISIAQTVLACIMVAITSLKSIPNDLANNKAIGILSLAAFSFLIFSYFLKNGIEPELLESDSSIRQANMIDNYYLDILERVAQNENGSLHNESRADDNAQSISD